MSVVVPEVGSGDWALSVVIAVGVETSVWCWSVEDVGSGSG